jgi:hypothetical protein
MPNANVKEDLRFQNPGPISMSFVNAFDAILKDKIELVNKRKIKSLMINNLLEKQFLDLIVILI